eukprot:TRINITY_DN49434_c0_g1_i1.p1 TRINITY_DN49434_c0_g1~~TRINITY_DN49434_c0_g1_i1.p1  ORF type:complete len:827 (+),score=125.07 TRINITY_DN49434_c0_g1_i1:70-2481(+)
MSHSRAMLCHLLLAIFLSGARGVDDSWAAFAQPGFQHSDRPHSDQNVTVLIAIRQRNLELLELRAQRVSDPSHRDYGHYLSRKEINGIASPEDWDIQIIRSFLQGLPGKLEFSHGFDLARFTCTVSCIESSFNTTLMTQKGKVAPGTTPIRAATPIGLPHHVKQALDGVSLNAPLFMPPRPKEPERRKFVYNSSGRAAPQIRPWMVSGDQFIQVHFVAFCKDGLPNLNKLEEGLCSHGGGTSIASFDILVVQSSTNTQKGVRLPAVSDVLGEQASLCGNTTCIELNATLGGIINYASTRVRIRAVFSDGTVSRFSDVNEVRPAWPMAYTTPSTLSKLYSVPLDEPIRHPRNSISVAEFLGQYYNPEDLEAFFKLMGVRSWSTGAKLRLIGQDEPLAGSVLGGEAQLDIQYITAMASNVSTIFWSVPSIELATRQEPFLDWLMQLADTEDEAVPLVHSVSYGDDALSMPHWFKQRLNIEFMKLALRGVTILVASGDDGVSGSQVASKGTEYCGMNREEFPASSPWVTAVGGTQFAKAAVPVCSYASDSVIVHCAEDREVVCGSDKGGGITSGGGFSSDFKRPWYQQAAVEHYLSQTDAPLPGQHELRHNASGRGFPDISAIANNYLVLMGKNVEAMSGTSASTPLVAAMVARWNEERLKRHLPTLGFLNPLIYRLHSQHPEAFNDIQVGDNRCSRSACCHAGFGAARGWDAVSGVGSPRFEQIASLIRGEEHQGAGAPSLALLALEQSTWPEFVPLSRSVGFLMVGALATILFVAARGRCCPVRIAFGARSALQSALLEQDRLV